MALIEIDVEPGTLTGPKKWLVRINTEDRSEHPNRYIRDLSSWKEALEAVRNHMEFLETL